MKVWDFVLFCFSVLVKMVREFVCRRMTFEEKDKGGEGANRAGCSEQRE